MRQKNRVTNKKTTAHATGTDFCRIFQEEMRSLYLLALLLTANFETAGLCFVASLQDCLCTNRVFKEWARSWTRRTIIQNAIRLEVPTPKHALEVPCWLDPEVPERAVSNPMFNVLLARVLELRPFDRFVFVMLVLERLSRHECSLLLGCSQREVIEARTRAFKYLASLMVLTAHYLPSHTLSRLSVEFGEQCGYPIVGVMRSLSTRSAMTIRATMVITAAVTISGRFMVRIPAECARQRR
jgi:hypothetical protein